jgi:predicted transcriptional regulator
MSYKNKGITKLVMSSKMGLSKTVITKLVRDLCKKGLIANFKTKDKQRMVYMGGQYYPDEQLTGGVFYKDGQIETDRVQGYLDAIFELVL